MLYGFSMAILRIYCHGYQDTCSPNVLIIFSLIHLLPIQVTVAFCVALLYHGGEKKLGGAFVSLWQVLLIFFSPKSMWIF